MNIHRLALMFYLLFGTLWIAISGAAVASAQGLMQIEEPQQEQTSQLPVTFKRAKLTFNGGETAKLKNATIENGTIRGLQFYQSTLTKQVSYDIRKVKSFMYSNTRGTKKGARIGGTTGALVFFIAIVLTTPAHFKAYGGFLFMVGLMGTFAGIGAAIGSMRFVDWQEYPLEE